MSSMVACGCCAWGSRRTSSPRRWPCPLMLDTGKGLLVEMTDGPSDANAGDRPGVGFYYDFVKAGVDRLVRNFARDLRDTPVAAVGVAPGWVRSGRTVGGFGGPA